MQHFVNIFFAIADLEHAALEARAAAFLADQLDVGQELHLDRDRAVALASFAAAAGNIERKMSRREAAPAWLPASRQKFRGSRRTLSDTWRDSSAACARWATGPPERRFGRCWSPSMRSHRFCERCRQRVLRCQRLVKHVMHQRGFSRTGDAGDRPPSSPSGIITIDILQIVRARAEDAQETAAAALRRIVRHGNAQFAVQIARRERFVDLPASSCAARRKAICPPSSPAPGPRSRT